MNLLNTESVILADGAIGEYLFSIGLPESYLASVSSMTGVVKWHRQNS